MAYECCDTKFDNLDEFKKHIKSRNWHKLNYSNTFRLKLSEDLLRRIIGNKKTLFGITNLIFPAQGKGILYLPFSKPKNGLVLKRSIVGDLEGPIYDPVSIKYRFNTNNLIYQIEFRIRRINEEYSDLIVLSSMSVNIGLLGRLMPDNVLKTLQKMITPQILVNEYIGKNISLLE